MRRCYLVCYDICDPKRLRHVLQVVKGFGEHWLAAAIPEAVVPSEKEAKEKKIDRGPLLEKRRDHDAVLGARRLSRTARVLPEVPRPAGTTASPKLTKE